MSFGGYIKAIAKHPGHDYQAVWIKNDLESLQNFVGGYIETVTIHGATKDIVVICDEEGRLKGKPYNCTIAGISFVGPIVIVGQDGEAFADAPYNIDFMKRITTEAEP